MLNKFNLKESSKIKPLSDRHPEYPLLEMKLISLYKDVSEKALQLEQEKEQEL